MNFDTISFLGKYTITLVAVIMSFQTCCDYVITNVEMPYRAAKHRNERSNSAAVMSATSSICRALVTMPTNRHTYAFLLQS